MMNLEIRYADESFPTTNPPRVLMADGIWLVPPELRPTVRTPPPDPVKAETRDWAVERVTAAKITRATRRPPTPKVKPPKQAKPPKTAKISELQKPRVCVDCSGPLATPQSKRCIPCRSERIRVNHNTLRNAKYVPKPRVPRSGPRYDKAELKSRRRQSQKRWIKKNLEQHRDYQKRWHQAKRNADKAKQKTPNVVL